MNTLRNWLFLFLALGLAPSLYAADDFPLRARYPDAPVISTDELLKKIDAVTIVDVRSRYEYDTLRIKGAQHISVSDKDFVEQVKALQEKQNKPIVFYCNGRTCHKSYDATILAQRSRINNVSVYDEGVFGWAKAHPERTVLIDKTPIKPTDLIEEEDFKTRLLDPKDFAAKVNQSIVLDIRDRAQRDNMLFPFKEQRAQLDEKAKIDAAVAQAKHEGKPLLVYDAAGKQVQWFQYYLESKGVKEYYFMKGGAEGFYNATLGKVSLGKDKS